MNVLLTGGSRGIGAATVRALHAAVAHVCFTYNTGEAAAQLLQNECGSRVWPLHCDLAQYDRLPDIVTSCAERMGRIDVLINNAATFDENPFFANTYDAWRAGWERTFAVNVFGTAHLSYLVLQGMRAQRRGKIVNIVSRAAHRGELTFPDYGAAKAAIANLTKSIARACAPEGVVAVAIAPGFIETEMASTQLRRRRSEIEAEIPLGRIGTAQEVADVIAFFASDAADYANGATIDLNGASYVR